ncbi:MAG: M43 family zinc metalloprotease [Bacteroidota bacterium]|nr:M43 family zinc metalloprotease [Bacteroidota bacterium]
MFKALQLFYKPPFKVLQELVVGCIFFVLCIGILKAQAPCAFDEIHQDLLRRDATYAKNVAATNQAIYEYSKTYYQQKNKPRSKPTYIVPVVIHLIVPPGVAIGLGNNLSNLQVEQGLDYLNQAFANQGPFSAINGVDVGIQFCLARRDPNNRPTNGITRNSSTLVNDPMCLPGTDANSDAQIKQLVNWDCRQYVNIWLVTDLFNTNFGCGLAGYAYFPGAPCTVDGIVQEARYWNTAGGARVTAHEMGHYFALDHTFNGGCVNANCLLDGDRVCDTPPDNSPAFAPCNTNSCNEVPDLPDDNTNYMDYTGCGAAHFTDGQRVRMIAALEGPRKSLIQSRGCMQLGDFDAAVLDLQLDNDRCRDTVCTLLRFRNDGLKSFDSIRIDFILDGIPQIGFWWKGRLNPNQNLLLPLPCFYVANGSHTLEVNLGPPNNQSDFFLANNRITLVFETFSKLELTLEIVTETHCISDGTLLFSAKGGTAPYVYNISNHAYSQSIPYFQLLVNGLHTVTVTDANECSVALSVVIPDSCKSTRNKSFITNKDARALGNDCYLLTPAINFQSGSVWYEDKISLTNSFDIFFDMNLGCIDDYGADGIAFVLQPISSSIGSAGGGIGFAGIRPSLAVEFDTWQNTEYGDPVYDHIAIIRNGNIDHRLPDNLAGPVGILPTFGNAEDCNFHKTLIRWNAKTKKLDVYFDCVFRASYTGDIIRDIFGGDSAVYFGFTSATGGAVNVHQICLNYVSEVNKLSDYTICEGESIQVSASSKLKKYKWSPSKGISRTDIYNPVFRPDTTTTYYLELSDDCGFLYIDSMTIFVKKLDLDYTVQLLDSCGSFSGAILTIKNPYDSTILYSIDGIYYSQNTVYQIGRAGSYTLFTKIGNCITPEIIQIDEFKNKLRDSLIWLQAVNCKDSGRIIITGVDGIPPYEYRINNGPWQNSGVFDKLLPGVYTIDIKDQTQCPVQKQLQINNIITKLSLKMDSADLELSCCDPNTFISVEAGGTFPYYYYSLDNSSWTSDQVFKNIPAGLHKIIARDEFGCGSDSILFQVNDFSLVHKDSQRIVLCEGEFITIGTDQYSTTGIYTNRFTNIHCCDSFVVTDLIVNPTFSFNQSIAICKGEEITVGTKKYKDPGIYIDTLLSQRACDSVIRTELMLHPVYERNQRPTICDGEEVIVANNHYKLSGDYTDTLQTIFGCDSIIQTHLTVRPVHDETFQYSLCKGQSVRVGAKVYANSGIFVDTLYNIFGCDSIVETQLKIDTVDVQIFIDSIICFGDEDGIIEIQPIRGIPEFLFAFNDLKNFTSENYFDQLTPGNYTIYIRDSLGCTESVVISLFEPQELMAELKAEIQIKLGEKIILKPILNFIPSKVQWFPTDGLSCSDCLNPEILPINNVDYKVIFTNDKGCEISAEVRILVDNQSEIYIPNVFSPNGDNINDMATVFGGESFKEVSLFQIYNRWGELVFENQHFQVNDLSAGWDGNYRNEKLNPAVFVYYARAIRLDNTEVVKSGNISLLR